MSFSKSVKSELAKKTIEDNCCIIAEMAGLTRVCSSFSIQGKEFRLSYNTENAPVARRIFTHLKKYYSPNVEISVKKISNLKKNNLYTITLKDSHGIQTLLFDIGIQYEDIFMGHYSIDENIVKDNCCKKAYLRGAFLGAGSVNTPEKSYHLEFVTKDKTNAQDLIENMKNFHLEAKLLERKDNYIVYLKEAEQISDFLSAVGAYRSVLQFENVRVLKDMRNNVNRIVNCETANLNKIVEASANQVEDIQLIEKHMGLDKLKDNLQDVAYLRLENREAGLNEIGKMLDPPLGKSGVNHRFKRIQEIANNIRRQEYGE